MNKQKTIPLMAIVGLISMGLAYTGSASAHEKGHHKGNKERIEYQHQRKGRDNDYGRERVVITGKKVKKIYTHHKPRRHDRHRKHRRSHNHGKHYGWYLDRHHRHSHPKKWRKIKRHQRHHYHEPRNYRYDDDGRIRFHIEYSSWL